MIYLRRKFQAQLNLARWQIEADGWKEGNIYATLAEILDPQPGYVHLDVGSGCGHLLAALRRRQQNLALLGMERSSVVIEAAREYMA